MRTDLITALIGLTLAAAPLAQALPISQAHIPVKASEWGQLSDAAKSGYALGAMQVAAYIESDSSAQSGCISRLDEALIDFLNNGSSESNFVVFDAMEMAMDACGSAPAQDDGLISVERVSSVLGDEQTSEVWYGLVIGMTDYLKIQVYGTVGEAAADCVEDISLGMAGIDFSDPSRWTDDPDESFVGLVANAALTECGLID